MFSGCLSRHFPFSVNWLRSSLYNDLNPWTVSLLVMVCPFIEELEHDRAAISTQGTATPSETDQTYSINQQFPASLSLGFYLVLFVIICLNSSCRMLLCCSFVVDFVIVNPFDLCSTSWAAHEQRAHAISLNTWACLELVWLHESRLGFMEPL